MNDKPIAKNRKFLPQGHIHLDPELKYLITQEYDKNYTEGFFQIRKYLSDDEYKKLAHFYLFHKTRKDKNAQVFYERSQTINVVDFVEVLLQYSV